MKNNNVGSSGRDNSNGGHSSHGSHGGGHSSHGNNSDEGKVKKNSRNKYRQEFAGDHLFDYKDPSSLVRFIGDGGKVVPSRISKLSIAQQKAVTCAVKKARNLALLPTGTKSYDGMSKIEAISPVPFEI